MLKEIIKDDNFLINFKSKKKKILIIFFKVYKFYFHKKVVIPKIYNYFC